MYHRSCHRSTRCSLGLNSHITTQDPAVKRGISGDAPWVPWSSRCKHGRCQEANYGIRLQWLQSKLSIHVPLWSFVSIWFHLCPSTFGSLDVHWMFMSAIFAFERLAKNAPLLFSDHVVLQYTCHPCWTNASSQHLPGSQNISKPKTELAHNLAYSPTMLTEWTRMDQV
jgi:hypothetical protein